MKKSLTFCFFTALAFAASPAAAQVALDLDGPGTLFTSKLVSPNGLIDLDEGNMVILGAQPVLQGNIPLPGAVFQAYFQTAVTNVVYNDGSQSALPQFDFLPFFTAQEITAQFAIPLLYTGLDGNGRLNLEVANTGANFVNFFYDSSKDANIPAGTGFGDGTNILSGTFVNLDFGVAPTLTSASIFEATATVSYYDPAFFSVPLQLAVVLRLDLDGLVKIPPQIPNSAQIVGYTPNSSDLLGSLDLTAKVVPEASSMIMVGLVATGGLLGIYRRRRNG